MTATSPSAASSRSRASANTAFRKATPRASPILVYVSAWIKCHYPDVFAAALLNSQPMGFYAPAQIVRDAQEHGVEVRPVDVNLSDWDCTLEDGPRAAERVASAPCQHARRYPHHACDAARLPADQRLFRRRRQDDRKRPRRGLRFRPRSLAAHAAAARRARKARARPMPSARSASTAAMRCGRSARCSARATRTTCRCSRASPCRSSSPTSRCRRCCRASR